MGPADGFIGGSADGFIGACAHIVFIDLHCAVTYNERHRAQVEILWTFFPPLMNSLRTPFTVSDSDLVI